MTVATLAAKGGKLTLGRDLLHDLIPRRTSVTVTVGPNAALDVPGLLAALDRYPYGCAEQTTSRALPLLYVNDVAKRIGLATDSELRERIRGAIARVLEMQDASGAFGIWGPVDGDMWLTSYVTDFLTRAKEAGYAVRQQAFAQALDRLQNFIGYAQDFERGGEERAYALYVLARNGRAPIGELRYYVDTKLERFSTPLAQAQLGAALAMMGDKAARRDGVRRRRSTRLERQGRRRVTRARLRHRHARRRGADHAGLRDRHRQGRGAAAGRRGRQGLSRPKPTPRRRSRPGCCWRRARWPRRPTTLTLTVNGEPHKGQLIARAVGRRS